MHALFLGRESTYKKASIRAPYPDHQPALVGLCKLAQIAEESAATIYSLTCVSLYQLYQAAEKIHSRLQACAEELGIASAAGASSSLFTQTSILLLNNGVCYEATLNSPHNRLTIQVYYHILLLTFRPFLIAEFALHLKNSSESKNPMWLRQARRRALEAAEDCIVYMNEAYKDHNLCRVVRFNAFFLESSSMVLFYDMLRNPSKLSYNKEYVKTALNCVDQMVKDEPLVHAQLSMREISRIIEQYLLTNTIEASQQQGIAAMPAATHDFLVDESQRMIYLNGMPNIPDPLIQHHNPNLFTTDLFNFFPLDTISDDSTSSWQI